VTSYLVALFSLEKTGEHTSWIVFDINNAFLHRNDCVIGDLDVLWANLSTALGDVTHSKAMLFLRSALTVLQHIEWVHIKFCDTNEEAWTSE
jgi:hypothetical protein